MNIIIPIFFIFLTIATYAGAKYVYKKFHTVLLVPIATCTLVLTLFLVFTDISYEAYMSGGKYIEALLGPAVVSLAYPLFQHRKTLYKYFLPISVGVFVGSLIGMISGMLLARILHLDAAMILSLAAKSVTTPVAMDITSMIEGVPSLAAVYVMFAGISGSMFGPFLLKTLRVYGYIGVGMGLGTTSHGIGTARALEIGKKEAAISSVAMTLSAIYGAVLCPFIVQLIL